MGSKRKVGYIIIILTSVLVLSKGIAWYITGSIAVQSELFNSTVDLLYSIIIVSGFFLSNREKTDKYPEGLVRLEPLVSLFVSGIIILTGFSIAYQGVKDIIVGSNTITEPYLALSVLILSLIIKFIIYYYTKRKSKEYRSPSLKATSVDSRNDMITSTVAIFGVISNILGYNIIEPLIGIVISLYIVYSGIKVGEKNIRYALGKSVSDNVKNQIKKCIEKNESVRGIHDFEVHYTGNLIDVSVHVEVDGGLTIEEGHKIEVELADSIRECTNEEINEINIHLDPYTLDEWEKSYK